ncbi:hypothetical protein F2Q70_00042317 [Brassica cretica]|uniref:Uncharacterized protein n=2 Tax=Brassica cretica TaxID=69181 RepID=A0A8S9KHU4_BRACR|nr:hypothetical protein F2Q70_00042317 [Brassica cretica]
MSGNTKDKIAVRNNAGKTTPAATAPMANAYTNATVLEKIENLAATFCHRKCNETSSRFIFLNIKGNDKSYQTPKPGRLHSEDGEVENNDICIESLPDLLPKICCAPGESRSQPDDALYWCIVEVILPDYPFSGKENVKWSGPSKDNVTDEESMPIVSDVTLGNNKRKRDQGLSGDEEKSDGLAVPEVDDEMFWKYAPLSVVTAEYERRMGAERDPLDLISEGEESDHIILEMEERRGADGWERR